MLIIYVSDKYKIGKCITCAQRLDYDEYEHSPKCGITHEVLVYYGDGYYHIHNTCYEYVPDTMATKLIMRG